MNNSSFIFIIITLFIVIPFIYFKFNFHKNNSVSNLLGIYGSLGIILTVYSIYKSIEINYFNVVNTQLTSLNTLLQNITNITSRFFSSNPNMKYYYDELFNNIPNQNETIRNKHLEEIFSNDILINIDSLINYIDSYKILNGQNFQLTLIENKIKKIIKQFMKSKIFIENWKKFKELFALDWTKTYMQLYFNQ